MLSLLAPPVHEMITPRDYQLYTVEQLFRYFETETGNPVVAQPTGTGKSVEIALFIREIFRRYRGQRILKLTHVKELIQQNLATLLAVWPEAPAGVYSAGLKRRETFAPITFAGIASAVKVALSFGHIDLVIVDECHLVSPKEGTMYQTFLDELRNINPRLKVIGFTATHYRLGQGPLTEDGGLFTDVCVDMTTFDAFNWFLDEGYLVPLIPRATSNELDVSAVTVQHGEYNLKDLQTAVDRREVTAAALREALQLAAGREHWLVFASGIEHAEHCAEELCNMGVSATCIHSKMVDKDRDARIAAFKEGRFRVLVNNGILTTGFDFPALDCIVVLRPTMSPGLWVQMLGRGTRPLYVDGFDLTTASGRLAAIAASVKRNCLVLDFAGNTRRLGPINDPVKPKKRGKGRGAAPVKVCEACFTYCHASVRVCPVCGFVFPLVTRFEAKAGTDELIRRDVPEIVSFSVDHVVYTEHRKRQYAGDNTSEDSRRSSLKVSYHCGLRVFHEWVCLEHEQYPLHRAHDWWRKHAGTKPPESVVDAFKRLDEVRRPVKVKVWINKKFPEVRDHEFS